MPPILATEPDNASTQEEGGSPDDVVFDKALKADGVEKLRESRTTVVARIAACAETLKQLAPDADTSACQAAEKELAKQEQKLERLDRVMVVAEKRIADE